MAGAFKNIASVAWDTNTGEVTVLGTGGQRLEARIAPMPSDPAVRVEADFQAEELVLVFDDSRRVVASLGDEATARERLAAQPVVYLDQCHWSGMARHLTRGEASSDEEAAAERMAEWARAGRILLPVSSGHMLETGPLYGSKRQELAFTMLGLCDGWFMRHPLEIRRMELVTSMQGRLPEAADIFGISPGRLFEDPMATAPSDFAVDLARVHARTVEVLSVYHTLVEESAIPESPLGEELTRRWAEGNHQAAIWARGQEMSRQQVDQFATELLLVDHQDDIAEAAARSRLSHDEFRSWLSLADEKLRSLPMLSRFREVLYLRLRNADEKWYPNDLVDMLFLCAAAGYADVVVGERRMADYLSRASASAPAGAAVTRKLPEAVAHIERLLSGHTRAGSI